MKKLIAIILLCSTYINAQTICDSVSYSVGSGQTFTLIGTNNSSDSVNFQWGVCYNMMCYSKDGDTVVFADVTIFDTVGVCFDIAPQWACNDCQYLVFTNGSWQLLNTITHVSEVASTLYNSKAYDLLGRELKYIPKGVIYIRNGRLYR
jgi:hypothetical protein|tara:strand:+ start:521 stop:967 length:447 start_codon:yes stop_codon:yes gene_type:complete